MRYWLLVHGSEDEPEGILEKIDNEPVVTWVNTGRHFYINPTLT